jgi:uncharacterized protein (UPF0212 family)
MSTRRCEFCEREIPIGAAVCPHCAKPLSAPSAWGRQLTMGIVAIVLAIAVFIAWGYAMR